MSVFTALLHSNDGKESYVNLCVRHAKEKRMSRMGMCNLVRVWGRRVGVFGRRAFRVKGDFLYVFHGTTKPTTGNWIRRNGDTFYKFERYDEKLLTPTKRKIADGWA